jgi:localization factor PodJL
MALYRKAAEHGNVRAMHNLAVLTAEGGRAGKPDYTVAAQWFRKAAEYGIHDSQYNLAILLARGLGVSQNLPLSYTWFAIAASQGDEDAGKKRDDVGAHLSAADLVAAKATAAAFHAKAPDAAANDVRPPQGATPSASTSVVTGSKLSQL